MEITKKKFEWGISSDVSHLGMFLVTADIGNTLEWRKCACPLRNNNLQTAAYLINKKNKLE